MSAAARQPLIPRTGDAFLDAQIVLYLANGGGWTITPERASLQCNDTSELFASYLGAGALIVRAMPDWWGYGDRTADDGYGHDVCCWPVAAGVIAVDFTAAQYGLTQSFPLIQRAPTLGELAPDEIQAWDAAGRDGEQPVIWTPADPARPPAWTRAG